MRIRLLITSWLMIAASPVYAGFCEAWEEGMSIGHLSPKDVREASGMAASTKYGNRIYWVNDSGDQGFLYHGDPDGKNIVKVKIADFKPRDAEALALAECPEGPCLAIGDIGDNSRKRKDIKISFVLEQKDYGKAAKILRTLTLEYPDGPHDAEAMAFLPGGDLLILTKEIFISRLESANALAFTLPKAESSAGGKHRLKKIGELPLKTWLSGDLFFAQVPTDMAVNPVRRVLGILTYGNAVEIPLEFIPEIAKSAAWTKGREYEVVTLKALAQQETVAYLPAPDRMVWSTEYRTPAAPIFSMTCTRPAP